MFSFLPLLFLAFLVPESSTVEIPEIMEQRDGCHAAYTACDLEFPDDYAGFVGCMYLNGCGVIQQ